MEVGDKYPVFGLHGWSHDGRPGFRLHRIGRMYARSHLILQPGGALSLLLVSKRQVGVTLTKTLPELSETSALVRGSA